MKYNINNTIKNLNNRLPVIHIEGNEVQIQRYGIITKYDDNKIILNNKSTKTIITGNSFYIMCIDRDNIFVHGNISKVEMLHV